MPTQCGINPVRGVVINIVAGKVTADIWVSYQAMVTVVTNVTIVFMKPGVFSDLTKDNSYLNYHTYHSYQSNQINS